MSEVSYRILLVAHISEGCEEWRKGNTENLFRPRDESFGFTNRPPPLLVILALTSSRFVPRTGTAMNILPAAMVVAAIPARYRTRDESRAGSRSPSFFTYLHISVSLPYILPSLASIRHPHTSHCLFDLNVDLPRRQHPNRSLSHSQARMNCGSYSAETLQFTSLRLYGTVSVPWIVSLVSSEHHWAGVCIVTIPLIYQARRECFGASLIGDRG